MKNAIVFFPYSDNKHPRKYHDISSTFDAFCEKEGAHHYNLYCARTRTFLKRVYVGKYKHQTLQNTK